MTRVLLVDGDPDAASGLQAAFHAAGYTVSRTGPNTVLPEMRRCHPDIVLLDVLGSSADGFEICRQIRRTRGLSDTGVIILSLLGSETDRVVGLEVGADDYISKPFSNREVLARTRAVLRRCQGRSLSDQAIQRDQLVVDPHRHSVMLGGRKVELSALEFRLLHFLASHPGYVFSRDQLLDRVWGTDRAVTSRNVDVCVCRIREKIEARPEHPRYLQTIHGVGYRFGDL